MSKGKGMTRRRFILSTLGVAGALGVGWTMMPPAQRMQGARPLPAADGEQPLNGWVKLAADGTVTVVICRSEMGQGVLTSLAMLLADEMEADWKQVKTMMAPVDPIYNNISSVVDGLPFHPDNDGVVRRGAAWMTAKSMRHVGVMMTGGSSSIKDLWLPMREAGAAARHMLIAAAAAKWQVPAGECRAEQGRVLHASGRSAGFGEFAAEAARMPLPEQPALKTPAEFRLIGKPMPRIDTPEKVHATARYGIDALPEGVLHASVLMCPTLGGRVERFDESAVRGLPGVRKVIAVSGHHGGTGGVAVIAERTYQALTALKKLDVRWDHGPAASISSTALIKQLVDVAVREEGFAYYRNGDAAGAMKGAARTVTAEYQAPFLAHAALEPINCTVLAGDRSATVWVSTQVPDRARLAVAKVLGLDAEQVEVKVQFLGGGFGRRLEVEFIAQAAEIAKAMPGVPVQTLWSREQDTTHDFYRPACAARWSAGLDAQGGVLSIQAHSAGPAILPQVLKRHFGLPAAGPDKTAAEGAFDQPYEWENARIAHTIVDTPLPVGFWRSVGHSHQAFFKESFVDELAHAAAQDPVAFRAALLRQHPRHLAVLERAAGMAGWSEKPAAASDGAPVARGIALHQSFGSIVAQVAEVSLGPQREIRVHRVVCVIDCGQVVNPQTVRHQMESSVVFALSAALHGEITIENGQCRQTNFHDQPVLRIDACPRIEVDIIASTEPPEGVGEPGVPPLAPAVANAIFALNGVRLRSLPLKAS